MSVSPASGQRSKIPRRQLRFHDERKKKMKRHDKFALDRCETKEAK